MKAKYYDYFRLDQCKKALKEFDGSGDIDIVVNGKEISLAFQSYDDNNDKLVSVVFKGKEVLEGHFDLYEDKKPSNRLILHSLDRIIFEGSWAIDGWIGMTRIISEQPIK